MLTDKMYNVSTYRSAYSIWKLRLLVYMIYMVNTIDESFWPCHTYKCVIVWANMSSSSHELSDDDSFDPSRFHGNMVHPGSLTTCSHILVWVWDSREQLQSVRDMDYRTIAFYHTTGTFPLSSDYPDRGL